MEMNNKMDLAEILEKIYQKIEKEINDADQNGTLNEVLKKYEFEEFIKTEEADGYSFYDKNKAKILIIGDSKVGKDILVAIAKNLGIREKKLEFELDYEKLTNYNFEKLRYTYSYSDILIGPMPHKVLGIEGFSSFLAMVEKNQEEFPKTIRLQSANELKITKESFKEALIKTRLYKDITNVIY